jgi:hypothetical protein
VTDARTCPIRQEGTEEVVAGWREEGDLEAPPATGTRMEVEKGAR